jgi:hypothetical protein
MTINRSPAEIIGAGNFTRFRLDDLLVHMDCRLELSDALPAYQRDPELQNHEEGWEREELNLPSFSWLVCPLECDANSLLEESFSPRPDVLPPQRLLPTESFIFFSLLLLPVFVELWFFAFIERCSPTRTVVKARARA